MLREYKGKSLLYLLDNYTVVDLETTGLDPRWDEIIEIALIKVHDRGIIGTYQTLVKPEIEIDGFITQLTGITNDMVADAPQLIDILPNVIDFIGDSILVGHNVHFDVNFLYDSLASLINYRFSNNFIDTMRISRHLYKELPHHRLMDLCCHLSVADEIDHRGLSDAKKTYECFEIMKGHCIDNGIDLKAKLNYNLKSKDISMTCDLSNEDSYIYKKTFVFTGTLDSMKRKDAMQAVVNHGGSCADGVRQDVNYLVIGNNGYSGYLKDGKSAKHKKAEKLKQQGFDIEIISENVFIDMLEDK